MADVTALVSRIRREAEAEAERRLTEARAEVAAADAAATATAEAETAAALSAARRTLEAEARAATADEWQRGTRRLASARAAAVTRVLAHMADALDSPRAPAERVRVAAALAREVATALPESPVTAHAHPDWVEAAVAALPGVAVVADAAVTAGIRFSDASGRVQVDATLRGRLARVQGAMAIEAARGMDAAAEGA
jgi:colicin import membrane protein